MSLADPSHEPSEVASAPPAAGLSDASPAQLAKANYTQAMELLRRNEVARARELIRQCIELQPDTWQYHFQLAQIADRLEENELAEKHVLDVLRLQPNFAVGHNGLGILYRKMDRLEQALHHGERAIALEPRNPGFKVHYAKSLHAAGRPQEAWKVIEPLIQNRFMDRWLGELFARLAPVLSREEQAVEYVEHILQTTNLPPTPDGKPLLHFAVANLLDRLGRYDEAFRHARSGNELIASVSRPFDLGAFAGRVNQKINYFNRRSFSWLPHATQGNRRPVLIVGMPRSGTTLVEQILSSHSQVAGGGELRTLGKIATSASSADWAEGQAFPECLELLSARKVDEIAQEYLGHLEKINPATRYVTDKMPFNFQHLDWAQLLTPGARVIHCVRSPLDTCLSVYMTNFAQGNEFKFKLRDLGTYYQEYRRLMEHWKSVLKLPILEVRYEDVVLDSPTQVRRMLQFLELPWEDACLEFYKNQRRVGTASEDQVRRPMYTSSIGRWKHYEEYLGELIQTLVKPTPVSLPPIQEAPGTYRIQTAEKSDGVRAEAALGKGKAITHPN